MERRALLAAVLSLLVLVGWQYLFPPPPPEIPPAVETSGTGQAPGGVQKDGSSPGAPTSGPTPAAMTAGTAPATVAPVVEPALEKVSKVISTPLYDATFSSEGGSLQSFKLKEYKAYQPDKGPLDLIWGLFSGGNTAPAPAAPADLLSAPYDNNLPIKLEGILDENSRYRLVEATDSKVIFERVQANLKVTRTYVLDPKTYVLKHDVTIENLSAQAITTTARFGINGKELDPEKEGNSGYAPHLQGTYYVGDEHKLIPAGDMVEGPKKVSGSVGWLGTDDRYFLRALIPSDITPGTVSFTKLAPLVFRAELDHGPMTLQPGQPRVISHQLYLGPKRSELLKEQGRELVKSLDFGMLSLFAEPLLWMLKQFHVLVSSWGLAIILLTFMVKLALYPLFVKQIQSAQKMKDFQPQMKALQEKYADDKARLNQEMMQFMQANKINPLGGCLPVVLQMPIWFALYHVLQNAIELYNESFFYLPDLSARDPYGISPLVLGGLMYVQQKMTPMAPGMDPMQVKLLQYMPLIFAGMMFTLPSGLVVYILVNTLLGITQQWYITRRMEQAAAAKAPVAAR